MLGISLSLMVVICLCVPYRFDDFACAKYETNMTLQALTNEFPEVFRIMPYDELLQETKPFHRFSKHISENKNEKNINAKTSIDEIILFLTIFFEFLISIFCEILINFIWFQSQHFNNFVFVCHNRVITNFNHLINPFKFGRRKCFQ